MDCEKCLMRFIQNYAKIIDQFWDSILVRKSRLNKITAHMTVWSILYLGLENSHHAWRTKYWSWCWAESENIVILTFFPVLTKVISSIDQYSQSRNAFEKIECSFCSKNLCCEYSHFLFMHLGQVSITSFTSWDAVLFTWLRLLNVCQMESRVWSRTYYTWNSSTRAIYKPSCLYYFMYFRQLLI
jgi:hypothetical protein